MTSIVCGPSGGIGGTPFADDIPSKSTVGQLQIRAAAMIDSVQFVHVGLDSGVIESPAHGGVGGELHEIRLGEDRYVASIKGRYGDFVDSLTITINPMVPAGLSFEEILALGLPPQERLRFGGKGGPSRFVYHAPSGFEIAGFCGRSANLVDAIGVVFRPLAERGLETSTFGIPGSAGGGVAGEAGGGPGGRGVPDEKPVVEAGPPATPSNLPAPGDEPPPEEPMKRSGGPAKPR